MNFSLKIEKFSLDNDISLYYLLVGLSTEDGISTLTEKRRTFFTDVVKIPLEDMDCLKIFFIWK